MKHSLFSALVGAVAALAVSYVLVPKPAGTPNVAATPQKESAFERVMRTRELRCGYYVFPPVTYRDANTGELSGFTIDMMNEIGKRAGIKIIWAEEYTWAGWTQGLETNRYDAACTPNRPDIPASNVVAFTIPFIFSGLYTTIRADDARFNDENVSDLNNPDYTFIGIDGDPATTLTQVVFPKAKLISLPPGTDNGTHAMNVINQKADAMIWDENGVYQFNQKNDQHLKIISRQQPLKIQAYTAAVRRNEMTLKDWLDNAILDLLNDGTIDRGLRKWEPEPGRTFLRVAPAYKAAE